MFDRPPLHIDFVITYQDKETETIRGYWFLTWIFGRYKIVVWRKDSRNIWIRAVPKYTDTAPFVEGSGLYLDNSTDVALYPSSPFSAMLDGFLSEHQKKSGMTGGHYDYYKKKQMPPSL